MSDVETGNARVRVRVLELARMQCAPAEIAGALVADYSMDPLEAGALVEEMEPDILTYANAGMCELRETMWRLAKGEEKAQHSALRALEVLGKAHLGYADPELAKLAKKVAEARKGRAEGLRLVRTG